MQYRSENPDQGAPVRNAELPSPAEDLGQVGYRVQNGREECQSRQRGLRSAYHSGRMKWEIINLG